MIDIHCHILPGVDGGTDSLEESIIMAKNTVRQGIHTVIATPHYRKEMNQSMAEDIVGATNYLNGKLKQENIPIRILPGQEVRMHDELIIDLEKGIVLPLNASRYVLLEIPTNRVPHYTSQLLFDMQIAGYRPIIAHPERNQELLKQPNVLYQFVKSGALMQISASSIVGLQGRKIKNFTEEMIDANLAHFIASSVHHSNRKQQFFMKEAFHYISKQFGKRLAYELKENSEKVVNGDSVVTETPNKIKGKKSWLLIKNPLLTYKNR